MKKLKKTEYITDIDSDVFRGTLEEVSKKILSLGEIIPKLNTTKYLKLLVTIHGGENV